jgi:nucleoside-diphosphate-sugar epimerase
MINNNKIILVTWWTWFIWANLLHKLVSEWFKKIHILTRKDSNKSRINHIIKSLYVHNVNLLDGNELDLIIDAINPDIIFHLAAAWTGVWKDLISIREQFEFNILWSINLIHSCKRKWFDYFIHTWSSSEYWHKISPMKEIDLLEPNNAYWITKASTSLYLRYLWEKEKLPIYTLRLFSVYWAYEDKMRLIPTLLINFIQNKEPNLSSPEYVRDYIYVDDVIDHLLNIDRIKWNFWWIYNIWSGIQSSTKEVVNTLKIITNLNIEAKYGEKIKKQYEPKVRVADNEKSFNTFHLEYTPLSLWLKKSFQRFKQNVSLYIHK